MSLLWSVEYCMLDCQNYAEVYANYSNVAANAINQSSPYSLYTSSFTFLSATSLARVQLSSMNSTHGLVVWMIYRPRQ